MPAGENMAGVWGVVLAGGQSRRMGADKALLTTSTGETFLERTYRLLLRLTSPCLVSSSFGRAYAGYPMIYDKIENMGPIAGICAVLDAAKKGGAHTVIAVACDLPHLESATIYRLVRAMKKYRSAVTVFHENGYLNMACAVYAVESLPYFERAIAAGSKSLWSVVPENKRLLLPYSDSDRKALQNCNTPEEYRHLLNE